MDRAQGSGSYGSSRTVLVGSLIGLVLAAIGITVLIDQQGGQKLLASIYDMLGNAAGAEALRNGQGDQFFAKLLLAAIALLVGVGGIWLLFTAASSLVERLRPGLRDRILPLVFIAPAVVLLAIYLVYPAVVTVIGSFQDENGAFTLDNWASLATPPFLEILRNNILWLLVATTGSVGLGLLTAALFDRIRRESLAKVFIFTAARHLARRRDRHLEVRLRLAAAEPAAVRAPERRSGRHSAIEPIPWATQFPINLPSEMVILIWLQTGFAMVVFSAAIKGVSTEIIEAARLDGASERQMFLRVIVPLIRGTIVTVTTTIAIATLKIFDIVMSISGGRNHDDVVAVRMFAEMFQFFNDGRAAALATVLFIAVLPVMILNLRNFRRQAAM